MGRPRPGFSGGGRRTTETDAAFGMCRASHRVRVYPEGIAAANAPERRRPPRGSQLFVIPLKKNTEKGNLARGHIPFHYCEGTERGTRIPRGFPLTGCPSERTYPAPEADHGRGKKTAPSLGRFDFSQPYFPPQMERIAWTPSHKRMPVAGCPFQDHGVFHLYHFPRLL